VNLLLFSSVLTRLIGLTLVIASIFKGYAVMDGQLIVADADDIWHSRWFGIIAAEFQLVLGLCLVLGFRVRLAQRVGLACFVVFAAMNAYKVWEGELACGCFGQVHVEPEHAFVINLAAIAGFCWCMAYGKADKHKWPLPTRAENAIGLNRLRAVWTPANGLLAGLVLLGIGITVRAYYKPGGPLYHEITIDQPSFDFGEVIQAQTLTHVFDLKNGWKYPITVVNVHSSP
jgi:uncharacterized membrane protein YphA (DoxX/SURF4 family)